MRDYADGRPTKEFFVDMLTRDIDLSDAILDLLDNCLDGVVRMKGSKIKKWDDFKYYEGYYAKINIAKSFFSIEDNCGGIPRKVAENYAFRMGRVPNNEDGNENLATVGIYGIGMKRAIFKIGRSATVTTKNNGSAYSVKIVPEWANDTNSWDFPIEDLSNNRSIDGTKIKITSINPSIAAQWRDDERINDYADTLIKAIQESYSFIIQKGFNIKVNDFEITPLPIVLLASSKNDLKPYIFQKEYRDNTTDVVKAQFVIGFYSPLKSDEELDAEIEAKRKTERAGITVICNDRVVLYNDKTHRTGWGEPPVPSYHTQFISIYGVVVFESNDPSKLPTTTTKRGIDLSSDIYADVKIKIREGLKLFTDYTNSWKGRLIEERKISKDTEKVSLPDIIKNDANFQKKYGTKPKNRDGASIYKPVLPKPKIEKNCQIIRFLRPVNEIKLLERHFFKDTTTGAKASKVGEKCFDYVLGKVKKHG
jgi:hypothetical protein